MLRDCVVIAVEGTHASGKTTLTHALAAHYRERGIHVATVEEPARHSPFIEEIVVHGKGQFGGVDLAGVNIGGQPVQRYQLADFVRCPLLISERQFIERLAELLQSGAL